MVWSKPTGSPGPPFCSPAKRAVTPPFGFLGDKETHKLQQGCKTPAEEQGVLMASPHRSTAKNKPGFTSHGEGGIWRTFPSNPSEAAQATDAGVKTTKITSLGFRPTLSTGLLHGSPRSFSLCHLRGTL